MHFAGFNHVFIKEKMVNPRDFTMRTESGIISDVEAT